MKKGTGGNLKRFMAATKMNENIVYPAIIVVFSTFLLLFGCISTIPLTATYDPAMHAEIVDPVISSQLYPLSWSPLADTGYTYPPLFHWIVFMISRLGFEPIAVVVTLGLFLYALFPFSLYLLGSLWGRKAGLLSAVTGAVVSSWTFVFLAGEYPQLMAMNFAAVFLYFYLKTDYLKGGIFLGLAALSHPFVPVYLVLFVMINLFLEAARKNKAACLISLKCLTVSLVIVSVWLPQYLAITQNATTHQWRNVRWYYEPGFVGFGELSSLFFSFAPMGRINPMIFLLSLAGTGFILARLIGRLKTGKDARGESPYLKEGEPFLVLFLFTVIFSVFHIPGTQYKFPDMLALAIPPLSVLGILYLAERLNNRKWIKSLFMVSVALVFLFSAYNVGLADLNSRLYKQKYVSTDAAREAAAWLREYDYAYSRIVKTGDDEVWFSVISHKYAMDPMVTDLEVLTENTKTQIRDREIIAEKINKSESVSELAGKYGIKYVITEEIEVVTRDGRLVYDKDGARIYEFSGKTD